MKVLVAGLGSIGQRHVRNLRTLLGVELEILSYRVRKVAPVLTDRLEVEGETGVEDTYRIRSYDRLDEALAERPDAAFVCNPTSHHMAVALPAARAGCHLFVEKPLSHSYDGVEELIALVEQRKLVAVVGYQMRFHPALRRVRSLLDERAIGQVLAVRVEVGEYLPAAHPYEDYRDSYAARADLGGGVVLSHSHELDYVCWLFGLPRRVFAIGGHLSRLDVDVEDTASILMECVIDGKTVPVHVSQDFVQRPPSRTCQIVGDAGKIRIDFSSSTFELFDGQGERTDCHALAGVPRNELFLDELKHFLACIRGDETEVATLRDGARTLRLALAARDSIRSGRVVDLT